MNIVSQFLTEEEYIYLGISIFPWNFNLNVKIVIILGKYPSNICSNFFGFVNSDSSCYPCYTFCVFLNIQDKLNV